VAAAAGGQRLARALESGRAQEEAIRALEERERAAEHARAGAERAQRVALQELEEARQRADSLQRDRDHGRVKLQVGDPSRPSTMGGGRSLVGCPPGPGERWARGWTPGSPPASRPASQPL
jgi:hypothetical protein